MDIWEWGRGVQYHTTWKNIFISFFNNHNYLLMEHLRLLSSVQLRTHGHAPFLSRIDFCAVHAFYHGKLLKIQLHKDMLASKGI